MSIGNFFKTIALITFSIFMLSACEEGPVEEAGEKIDDSVNEIKDAGESVADEAEDACDDVTDGNC